MRILIVLTYYRPHVSGLTIYVERLARELAARGHQVTVLTSRHDRSLPRVEWQDGMRIVRVPVWFRISKGVVMPMPFWAARLAWNSDVVSIHLPQFDGGFVAAVARLLGRRIVLTYHCDLRLPRGVVNRLADAVTYVMNYLAGRCTHRIVAYTADYATHSALLRRFPDKITVIPPPVIMGSPDPLARRRLRDEWKASHGPILGIAARLATEKGVEFVVRAMPRILQVHPDAHVVFAGPHVDVVGEAHYRRSLEPDLRALGDRWRFLGVLDPGEMVDFFGAIDVLVVSSINGTESFGLVQVEAMLCGTPVIATDLPGVRQPVAMTGMGLVVPPRDSDAIADAVDRIVTARAQYQRSRARIEERFDLRSTVDAYERLFQPR